MCKDSISYVEKQNANCWGCIKCIIYKQCNGYCPHQIIYFIQRYKCSTVFYNHLILVFRHEIKIYIECNWLKG